MEVTVPPKITDSRPNPDAVHAVEEQTAAGARSVVATYAEDLTDGVTLMCMLGVEPQGLVYKQYEEDLAGAEAASEPAKKATKKAAKKTAKKSAKNTAKKTAKKTVKKAAKKAAKKTAKKTAKKSTKKTAKKSTSS